MRRRRVYRRHQHTHSPPARTAPKQATAVAAAAAGLIGGRGGGGEEDGEAEGREADGEADSKVDALGGRWVCAGDNDTEEESEFEMLVEDENDPLQLAVLVAVPLGASEDVAFGGLGVGVDVAFGNGEAVALVMFGQAVGLDDTGRHVDEPGGVG